ncbi:Hypothetical_protein [Hexamita inflata]|uniref:Hypothetical_protein n=1 Tax=Hexamita inflata TaxID=28002 RepID=A0AA86U3V1_9EUKA|nr:Hypothetical protein HINF_LOCUS17508 [Hexamita inflata]
MQTYSNINILKHIACKEGAFSLIREFHHAKLPYKILKATCRKFSQFKFEVGEIKPRQMKFPRGHQKIKIKQKERNCYSLSYITKQSILLLKYILQCSIKTIPISK